MKTNMFSTKAGTDPFLTFPLSDPFHGQFQFTISGVTPGRTNVVESSRNLSHWTSVSTNGAVSNSLQIIDHCVLIVTCAEKAP